VPLVERHYRVDPARRALFGLSAGGTFALYSLFTNAGFFTDYVVASPGPDREVIRLEATLAEAGEALPVGLFLSAGEHEMFEPLGIASYTAQLTERLLSRHHKGFRLKACVVPRANHIQTGAPSIAAALTTILA
jgi:predicted alpha/beta superfamily hydrolase